MKKIKVNFNVGDVVDIVDKDDRIKGFVKSISFRKKGISACVIVGCSAQQIKAEKIQNGTVHEVALSHYIGDIVKSNNSSVEISEILYFGDSDIRLGYSIQPNVVKFIRQEKA